MYKFFIRPIFFLFNAEFIHRAVLTVLSITCKLPGIMPLLRRWFSYTNPQLERILFGLHFKNPVGLAAGFDKDGKWIDEMGCFGFGFIEIGTITPQAQEGHPTPRLYRLPCDQGLINRMGFNNAGAQAAADRLEKRIKRIRNKHRLVIGGNIGRNRHTPNERAIEDYEVCFRILYPYVDYFVVNVSSPNTVGLRALQHKEPLTQLLQHIKTLSDTKKHPKPVLLKIAPDLNPNQLENIVRIIRETKIDGVVATNTTIYRGGLKTNPKTLKKVGEGGLSGAPLSNRATDVIRHLRRGLGKQFPIIGVGGIMSPEDALEKIEAGADLVQLYTGMIYEGPALVKRINRAIHRKLRSRNL